MTVDIARQKLAKQQERRSHVFMKLLQSKQSIPRKFSKRLKRVLELELEKRSFFGW